MTQIQRHKDGNTGYRDTKTETHKEMETHRDGKTVTWRYRYTKTAIQRYREAGKWRDSKTKRLKDRRMRGCLSTKTSRNTRVVKLDRIKQTDRRHMEGQTQTKAEAKKYP